MKNFWEKNKKWLIIVLILLLVGIVVGSYFLFFANKDDNTNVGADQTSSQNEDKTTVTPMPEYDERSSNEAIIATSTVANEWSSDAKLYNCSGITMSSVVYPDITYEYLGVDQGMYAQWNCEYYSKSKNESAIYIYKEGVVKDDAEPMDAGEYAYMTYGSVNYPTDLESIVDSTNLYAEISEDIDLENNYLNMYLGDTVDYGYVWHIDERSKSEVDEYGINTIVNTYVFDILTGRSKGVFQEEIY